MITHGRINALTFEEDGVKMKFMIWRNYTQSRSLLDNFTWNEGMRAVAR